MAPGAQNGASVELQQQTPSTLASAPSSLSTRQKPKKDNFAKRLYRQNLRGYVPIPSPLFAIGFFSVTGTVLMGIGIAVLAAALSVNMEEIRYDNQGTINNVNLTTASLQQANAAMLSTAGQGSNYTLEYIVTTDLKAPVYVYYKLGNFYQNYRRYINSVSWRQIHGDNSSSVSTSTCAPLQYVYSVNGTRQANPDFPNNGAINPCGLWAWSYFNDTYSFSSASGQQFVVSSNNLAWPWQRSRLFGGQQSINFNTNTRTNSGQPYLDTVGGAGIANNGGLNQDERFMVWMRPEAHFTFQKLWGVINTDIPKGTRLLIAVTNRYNTYGWGGVKAVILSENSWMGGRNPFLGSLMIAVGGVYYICALVFIVGRIVHHRPMGDERYLSWHRQVEKKSVMQGFKNFVRR